VLEQSFRVTVGDGEVSALTTPAEGQTAGAHFIYAPGAGSNINDGFGRYLANSLAASGITTVRFQFPYMEARKRRPDAPRLLELTWREIIETVRYEISGASKIVVGGRSMGGRIASQVVAQDTAADALALFAYPLRPPGNPERVRNGHFPDIGIPTLFCSGTRDSFGTPDELTAAAAEVSNSTVHLLEGADHGFAVLKSTGKSREDVWAEAVDALLDWLQPLSA
jgi:predicted alpha/beta-hydrolase family hydrolase